ncbi:MAG: peptidylprolyl isomerase [Flavobacteriales bacterium]|jgi:peptidyl-prolyl cis-trans isomerase D|nr:peptidylprolyl isomerase [Flavobacteriales bacterium]
MAVIGKIRERSGLLLVVVGGALAAFVLTDLFSGRGGQQDQVLGEVGGQEISLRRFEQRVSEEVDAYRDNFGQQVNAQMQEQVRNTVWDEMVRARVMLDRVESAGFGVHKDEYDDIRFGNNVLPEYRNQPNLTGPDGQPDRAALQQYFQSVQLNAPIYHNILKRRITEGRLYTKYTNLVKKSTFVNKAQAEQEFHGRNTRASFDLVAKRYTSEPDSLYPVSERDLRRFHDQHRNDPKYRQEPSRAFSYVRFPVTASEEDRRELREELEGLREEFAATENDSAFVLAHNEPRMYNLAPYAEGTADRLTDSIIVNGPVGTVAGPYTEGDRWKLVKVKSLDPVPEARVRHILLSTQQGKGDAEQSARADSLLAVVKRDRSKFPDLVSRFSDDPGSVNNGGVYEWFDKGRMVPEFTAASFDEKVGAITIAKTSFGYHIVEVLDQRDRDQRLVVSIERPITPSPATFREVYKKANDFSLRHRDLAAMEQAAAEDGLVLTPVEALRPDMRFVPGLQQPNATITWANRAKVGQISEPLDAGDAYTVAILTGIRAKGAPQLEDVRETFTAEVIKVKKAEDFIARMQGNTDLAALASDIGATVQPVADMLFSSSNIPGGYNEPEVSGKIFSLATGDVSVPMKGDNGVYVVRITNTAAAPEPEDVSSERSSLLQRDRTRVDGTLYSALRDAVGVQDDRSKYY